MSTFIEQELKHDEDPEIEPRFRTKTTWKSIFCSQFAKGIFIALLVAVVLPTVAYYIVISRHVTHEEKEQYYCLIQEEYRVSCGVVGISRIACQQLNCCFNETTEQCHHFIPSKYFYKIENNQIYVPSQKTSPFGIQSLSNLQLSIQEKSADKFSLVIHDPSEEVENKTLQSKNYTINLSTKKLILEVLDNDGDAIFSTAKGALIASKYYWEWSFQLSNDSIFGLDRNVITLSGNETLTKVIYKNRADHTTLPVFWAYQNGKFHGCVIKHDGPLEIQVLASNIVILRSLLGKKIEVELSLGPTPFELYKQQVGETVVPPLWAMGTHNCRSGEIVKLKEILKVYAENKESSFDTDCFHKNILISLQMNNTDEDLANFQTTLQELQTSDTKFMLSLPPHIVVDQLNPLYLAAKQYDILYKYQSGIIYNGSYLGHPVVYPDYTDPNIDKFIKIVVDWFRIKGIENISGLVLNDNWPQDDFYRNVEKVDFSYYSDEIDSQMKFTLPWTLQGTDNLLHLEKHNSYGSSQKTALYSHLKNTTDFSDSLIISATKNFGDTEPEISDNFETSWDNFKMYLNTILFNSIAGNQMIGLPVCGDSKNYDKALQETLCLRWYIAAATMPYFQVSSGLPFRDPANLNSKFAANVADLAISRRKMFLDYFYTIMNSGEPLVRPMYYNYYRNKTTFTLDRQYTIGSELIVAQPFSNGKVKLQVYLPPERGKWYEFWGGTVFSPQRKNDYTIEIDSLETDWTLFIAQGHIVTLTDSDQMDLYIALDCSSNCSASGYLLKENKQLRFIATNTSVTISNLPIECNYILGYLKVYEYHGASGLSNRYEKNVNLCDNSTTTVTVSYLDEE